jgi:ribosomal protein S6E (S10)
MNTDIEMPRITVEGVGVDDEESRFTVRGGEPRDSSAMVDGVRGGRREAAVTKKLQGSEGSNDGDVARRIDRLYRGQSQRVS